MCVCLVPIWTTKLQLKESSPLIKPGGQCKTTWPFEGLSYLREHFDFAIASKFARGKEHQNLWFAPINSSTLIVSGMTNFKKGNFVYIHRYKDILVN